MLDPRTPFNWQEANLNWQVLHRDHLVQWYETDSALVQCVGAFMAVALRGEQAAIVIATESHRIALEQWLEAEGLDVVRLQREGRYIPLDARQTLDRLFDGDCLDEGKFTEIVGGLVSRASVSWGGVRAFGEMVALLWVDGNREGALELEGYWNKLGEVYPFALFCAYPKQTFSTDADREAFARVCDSHSTIIL